MLGWAAAAVGVTGIVSALTPEFANRSDFVRGVLPPGVPGAARIAALTFGLTLIWLSRSLAGRRRRAWQLGIVLVVGLTVAHLAKGLDFEEATFGLLVLAALYRFRKRFDVPGDPLSARPLVVTLLALTTTAALVVVLDLRGFRGDRIEDVLAAVSLLLGFRALHLWLRPLTERVRQSAEERRLVRGLIRTHGDDSLAFFSLRRDKSYFFSPSHRSFLAYKVVGGCALVSGDPVGERAEILRVAHRVPSRVSLARLAARAAERPQRAPTRRARSRPAGDQDRRRGGCASFDLLAGRPADSQGPPVGDAPGT